MMGMPLDEGTQTRARISALMVIQIVGRTIRWGNLVQSAGSQTQSAVIRKKGLLQTAER